MNVRIFAVAGQDSQGPLPIGASRLVNREEFFLPEAFVFADLIYNNSNESSFRIWK